MTIENSRIQSRGNEYEEELSEQVVTAGTSKMDKKRREPTEEVLVNELYKIIKKSQDEQERLRERLRGEENISQETSEAIQ